MNLGGVLKMVEKSGPQKSNLKVNILENFIMLLNKRSLNTKRIQNDKSKNVS